MAYYNPNASQQNAGAAMRGMMTSYNRAMMMQADIMKYRDSQARQAKMDDRYDAGLKRDEERYQERITTSKERYEAGVDWQKQGRELDIDRQVIADEEHFAKLRSDTTRREEDVAYRKSQQARSDFKTYSEYKEKDALSTQYGDIPDTNTAGEYMRFIGKGTTPDAAVQTEEPVMGDSQYEAGFSDAGDKIYTDPSSGRTFHRDKPGVLGKAYKPESEFTADKGTYKEFDAQSAGQHEAGVKTLNNIKDIDAFVAANPDNVQQMGADLLDSLSEKLAIQTTGTSGGWDVLGPEGKNIVAEDAINIIYDSGTKATPETKMTMALTVAAKTGTDVSERITKEAMEDTIKFKFGSFDTLSHAQAVEAKQLTEGTMLASLAAAGPEVVMQYLGENEYDTDMGPIYDDKGRLTPPAKEMLMDAIAYDTNWLVDEYTRGKPSEPTVGLLQNIGVGIRGIAAGTHLVGHDEARTTTGHQVYKRDPNNVTEGGGEVELRDGVIQPFRGYTIGQRLQKGVDEAVTDPRYKTIRGFGQTAVPYSQRGY